ncbi:glycosyl transferase family group 2-domain-containing protein [Obelidium mucronatum]|nr:glycosyl transferase family group 2-domain-containing protein [Obelidium mucronatum]
MGITVYARTNLETPRPLLRKAGNVMRHLFQRLPGFFVLATIPFLMLAPYYTPTFFAVYYAILMIAISIISLRTTFGIMFTVITSYQKSKTDWQLKREQHVAVVKEKLGSCGELDQELLLTVDDVFHVIVVPNYKESVGTLTETLDVLASHSLAKTNYKVCLAMEENEAGSEAKAVDIIAGYTGLFHTITYTVHPKDIPGEIRGKSSNTNWACTQLYYRLVATGSLQESLASNQDKEEVYINDSQVSAAAAIEIKRHIFTCMDADSCFASTYFVMAAYEFVTLSPAARRAAIFIPSIVFDRNSDSVNPFVRMVDASWSAIQLGVFMRWYPFKPATSAYSLSMELARAVGFWDTGREALGEDYHMTFKCYFATRGRLQMIPIYSPASQCNVVGVHNTSISGIMARVQQTRRHMWGALDFGYILRQTVLWMIGCGNQLPKSYFEESPRNSKISTAAKKIPLFFRQIVTLVFVFYHTLELYVFSSHVFICSLIIGFFLPHTAVTPGFLSPISDLYWKFLTGDVSTPLDPLILNVTRVLGSFMVVVVICVPLTAIGYELYYYWNSRGRWGNPNDLEKGGVRSLIGIVGVKGGDLHPVLGLKPYTSSKDREWWMIIEWVLYPVVGFFTSIMLLHACLMHLFTDRLDYQVSAKPESLKKMMQKKEVPHQGLNNVDSLETLTCN